jgi:hypothetical protein
MNDEPDKREGKNPKRDPREDSRAGSSEDSRQDRLKLALRENLKRRKSQARGRSGVAAAPSEQDGQSPHEASGKTE